MLCEILNENGDRATRSRLHKIAQQHGLPIITIEELIRYRRRIEKLVYRQAEADLPTKYGRGRVIVYGVKYETMEPAAVVIGNPSRLPSHRWSGCILRVSRATSWHR